MRLKLIAITTMMVLSAPSFAGYEIYKDDQNRVTMGGDLSGHFVSGDDYEEIIDGFSRINFIMTHELTDGWSSIAKVEWAVRFMESDADLILSGQAKVAAGDKDQTLSNRLGFLGINHETYGAFTLGKQWGPTYMITGATDWFHIFGGDGAGTYHISDGGYSGVGRAEKAIQYNNAFGDFAVSFQYQATNRTAKLSDEISDSVSDVEVIYDSSYGAAVVYQSPYNFTVGVSHNVADVQINSVETETFGDVEDILTAANVTYGVMGDRGIYAALVMVESEYHELDNNGQILEEANGIEAILTYRFANNVQLIGGLIGMESDTSGNDFERKYYIAGVAYYWSDYFRVYTELKIDDSTNADGSEVPDDDVWGFGARFTF